MMGPVETVSTLIALAGCFVGLAGWLSGRDKKIIGDAEWRGNVDAKLDTVVGYSRTIDRVDGKLDAVVERVVAVEHSSKQAHKRLDGLEGREHK